jgi:hypothetical protein
MEIPYKKLFAVFVLALAAPLGARADNVGACQAGLVTTIQFPNPACTIGDKTFFFFTWATSQSTFGPSVLTADKLLFTPDASNPNSPGFTLSAAPGFSLSETSGSNSVFQFGGSWGFAVSLTDPSSGAAIVGTTTTWSGAAVSQTDPTSDALVVAVSSQLFCATQPPNAFAQLQLEVLNGNLIANSGATRTDDPGGFCGTDGSGAIGSISLFIAADNGTASLGSAAFYVDEAPGAVANTPEPASLFLMACGGIVAVGYRARRQRGGGPRNDVSGSGRFC